MGRDEAQARGNYWERKAYAQVDAIHSLEETTKLMLASIKKRSGIEDSLRDQLARKDEELTAKDAEIAAMEAQLARQTAAIRGVIAEIGRCPACWDHMDAPMANGCGHTLCQECMTKCRGDELPCPVCRGVVRRPVRNFGLGKNFGKKFQAAVIHSAKIVWPNAGPRSSHARFVGVWFAALCGTLVWLTFLVG
ncbi:unnamed protein product [Caenorhabditis brenneri]